MRKISILSFILLCGCAANGPAFDTSYISPSKDSKIVVYRGESYYLSARKPDVLINGMACELPQRAFISKEIPSGKVELSISMWDLPGTTRYSFSAEKGKTYFIKTEPNKQNLLAGSAFGLAGMVIEDHSGQGGQFIFTQEPREVALQTLKNTKQACY